MGAQRHTKDSIILTLQNLAQRLGREELHVADITGVISKSSINYHFGSLGRALEAAGLPVPDVKVSLRESWRKQTLAQDELCRSLMKVERQVGHEPNRGEYQQLGDYSTKPFSDRFGAWTNVIANYRKWKADMNEQVSSPEEVPSARTEPPDSNLKERVPAKPAIGLHQEGKLQLYGKPLDFRGLRHAPINEQGVVYLFGMVSRELGFNIEALQQGFPDCEGKYLYNAKKNLWAKARIEFEFRASSFKEHGHDASQCDFIVCWENDWIDCPITVIELSKEILKLPARSMQ